MEVRRFDLSNAIKNVWSNFGFDKEKDGVPLLFSPQDDKVFVIGTGVNGVWVYSKVPYTGKPIVSDCLIDASVLRDSISYNWQDDSLLLRFNKKSLSVVSAGVKICSLNYISSSLYVRSNVIADFPSDGTPVSKDSLFPVSLLEVFCAKKNDPRTALTGVQLFDKTSMSANGVFMGFCRTEFDVGSVFLPSVILGGVLSSNSKSFFFSKGERKVFISYGGTVVHFPNSQDLVKAFPSEHLKSLFSFDSSLNYIACSPSDLSHAIRMSSGRKTSKVSVIFSEEGLFIYSLSEFGEQNLPVNIAGSKGNGFSVSVNPRLMKPILQVLDKSSSEDAVYLYVDNSKTDSSPLYFSAEGMSCAIARMAGN